MRNGILFAVIFCVLFTSAHAKGWGKRDMLINKKAFSYLPEATQAALRDAMSKGKSGLWAMMDEYKSAQKNMKDMEKAMHKDKDKSSQTAKEIILIQLDMERNLLEEKLKVIKQAQAVLSNN